MNYTIKNEFLTVEVSDEGAQLQSIRGADGTEYLWQADPAYWKDKAPNLFPYIARMTDGKYTVNGNEYEMNIHGFVKYMTLTAEKQECDAITFRLDSCEETKAHYPFEFTYRITYRLDKNRLLTTNSVENRGAERMYFAIGGHPGFNVPMEEGLSFEDYYLEFSHPARPNRIGFTDECFLTSHDDIYPLADDRRLPLRHEMFAQDAIVLKNAARSVKIASDKGKKSITVDYPDFQYIGFWHKPNCDAPYVCVEPWSALPSRDGIVEELTQQADLTRLDAGRSYETTWVITVE